MTDIQPIAHGPVRDSQGFLNVEPVHTADGSGVTYIPWSNGQGAIGFAVERGGKVVDYIYLNPTTYSDDDVPNVFIYTGSHGDPALDSPHHHYIIAES